MLGLPNEASQAAHKQQVPATAGLSLSLPAGVRGQDEKHCGGGDGGGDDGGGCGAKPLQPQTEPTGQK